MAANHPQTEKPYKEHPVFTSPGITARIWRYCDFAKLVSLLDKEALYFALASVLEDPFEGALPRLIANTVPRDVLPVLIKNQFTNFVSCWHLNDYESAAMWQLYSRMSEGLAIQSTFGRLTSSFRGFSLLPSGLPAPNSIFAGMVHYIDYNSGGYVDGRWALNGLSALIHKRMSFAHEREVRAICWIPANCGTANTDITPKFKGIYVDCDVHELIERIYVSPLAAAYYKEAVAATCERFGLASTIIQSDLMQKPLY